jgi:exoribonuclease II
MSLKANTDAFALSLGVELDGDGSIIDSSILVTSSKVRVSYRLTYDDVDEMIEDGIAYSEEWELGALYSAALLRREHRIRNGSAEAFVPTQIPQYSASTFTDKGALEDTGIALNIQVSHNGGKNQSSVSEDDKETLLSYASPVSAASMLVTGNYTALYLSMK